MKNRNGKQKFKDYVKHKIIFKNTWDWKIRIKKQK